MGLFSRQNPDLSLIQSEIENQNKRVRDLLGTLEGLEGEIRSELRALAIRVEDGERSLRVMAEELDERIDRGNKIWRRIRARERAEEERAEFEEESETDSDLPLFDGNGSGAEGVHPVRNYLEDPPVSQQGYRAVGRALARRLAGLE